MISHPRSANPLWPIAIFVAAALACEPALFNTFTFDDMTQVRDLPLPAAGPAGWLRAAADPWWPPERGKNIWRPVTRLTILAQKAVAGSAAWPFYAFNIALHGAVAVLLFLLARRLGLTPAAAGLGALLFAVHPAHAEAVHQVVGRAELLAAFFMLAGSIVFWDTLNVRAEARTPNVRSASFSSSKVWSASFSSFLLFWIAQPLCFALALGSKEHALVYPFLLFLLVLVRGWGVPPSGGIPAESGTPEQKNLQPPASSLQPDSAFRIPHSAFLELLAILLLVFALFLMAKAAITGGVLESPASVPDYENPLASMPVASRLPAALGVLGYAASRLVWPLGLAPDYSAISLPFGSGWAWPFTWLGLALLLLALAWAVRDVRRGGRGWALAAAAFTSYLLVSNLFFTIGVSTAQRLWYWPSAPVCLVLGWALTAAGARLRPERRRLASLLAAALIVALMALAWGQAAAWRSPEAFARVTIEIFPASWRGQVDTARACYRERDFAAGREHARAATRAFPDLADGWAWLGSNAMFIKGHEAEAEAAFKVALILDPALYETHRHYGHLLVSLGRRAEAAAQFQAFLESDGPTPADREKVQREWEALLAGT